MKQPEKIEAEVEALDQATDEIITMSRGFDAEAAGIRRSTLDRLISSLESTPEYFVEFGFHVTTFKKGYSTFSAIQLREALEEPLVILATNYHMHETEAKPRGGRVRGLDQAVRGRDRRAREAQAEDGHHVVGRSHVTERCAGTTTRDRAHAGCP